MELPTPRVRKSEKLTTEEFEAFKKWISEQDTKLDAAEVLGISTVTLSRLFYAGCGRPSTISKIREVLTSDVK